MLGEAMLGEAVAEAPLAEALAEVATALPAVADAASSPASSAQPPITKVLAATNMIAQCTLLLPLMAFSVSPGVVAAGIDTESAGTALMCRSLVVTTQVPVTQWPSPGGHCSRAMRVRKSLVGYRSNHQFQKVRLVAGACSQVACDQGTRN